MFRNFNINDCCRSEYYAAEINRNKILNGNTANIFTRFLDLVRQKNRKPGSRILCTHEFLQSVSFQPVCEKYAWSVADRISQQFPTLTYVIKDIIPTPCLSGFGSWLQGIRLQISEVVQMRL